MDITTVFYTLLFGKKVGEDEFGNKYYTHKSGGKRYGREVRWALFKGSAEASKVNAEWEGWLRHSVENPITKQKHVFQKPHVPNLTGTKIQEKPKYKTKEIYSAWGPKAE